MPDQDLGERISYLTLKPGAQVFSSDGQKLGKVVKVLSEPRADVFDGVVFDTTAGPGGHKFVDAPEVGDIYERGLVLKIDAAEAANLPKPAANAGSISVNPADLAKGSGGGGLRRFWDRLSGK